MSEPIGLGVDVSGRDLVSPRHSPRRPTISTKRRSRAAVPVSTDELAGCLTAVRVDAVDTRRAATDDHALGHASTSSSSMSATTATSGHKTATNDSGFSRHDSLFSFGVSSSRNAAELKSLLGNSSSRLKPGATVISMHDSVLDKRERRRHAVSLEQAKHRARVEVDIVLESDCLIEGGYMRGSVKLRVRRRQKKEAAVLLAEGRVRVIGFECIPGESDRHTFYQRASPLSAITDAYTGVYDSPPDAEGFSRAMEGVHVLPFAMQLPIDDAFGSAKGAATVQSGVTMRYIAMISVKVKDSQTGKRSIAHFYRDCEVWPRMNPSVVLANAPRPIQASTAKSLSVVGSGSKLKLTAMLHRMTWIAGQRCAVRIWIANETKKSIKSVTLTLVRTTTLFKPKPQLDPGDRMSIDPDACQTATTHKVVGEALLERSHSIAKGHASAQGWWTGVQPGQEAQFSHWIVIPPEALSVARSRLVEVEYSIRVTVSAGALTPDVHVTLPMRIINFLSVDPTPSDPLVSSDGSYARLIPYESHPVPGTLSHCDSSLLADHPSIISQRGLHSDVPSLATATCHAAPSSRCRHDDAPNSTARGTRRIPLDTPMPRHAVDKKCEPAASVSADQDEDLDGDLSMSSTGTSESTSSMFSASSSAVSHASSSDQRHGLVDSPTRHLGNLELDGDADSDEEIDCIIGTAQLDSGRFPDPSPGRGRLGRASKACVDGADVCAEQSQPQEASVGSVSSKHSRLPGGSVRGPRHIREGAASSDGVDVLGLDEPVYVPAHADKPEDEGEEEEEDESDRTPRLGSSACPSTLSVSASDSRTGPSAANIAARGSSSSICTTGSVSDSDLDSDSGSQPRMSRQLPQPPPRPSQLSNIPESVSALEAIRFSHLSGSSGSTLPRSTAHRSLPTTPTRPPVSAVFDDQPSHCRPAYERSETVPPSLSVKRIHQRPTQGLRNTGQSESSAVRGRIAAFEERLKHSRDTGAAYE
ncbi:hypothetical protein K466DRAFT_659016 [Polyporus arcularius HHB13444]|uniref:Arrestin C-terminal-like domain-containing protein n=1 Tax=Polyporus arcularius HHB13444 TaxID=1314778 RepID=A0A5C3PTG1_9APHY|nr:hypothetical protein K466DRAFT_659016 [Polyporus arcularius HHB13444]